jgi:hypothetical protein
MIVRDFHVKGVAVTPLKTDAPLPVYAYTVLALAITAKPFQVIAGRHAQVVQRRSGIQHDQLPQRPPLNWAGQALDRLSTKEAFCFFVGKSADHTLNSNALRYCRQGWRRGGCPGFPGFGKMLELVKFGAGPYATILRRKPMATRPMAAPACWAPARR